MKRGWIWLAAGLVVLANAWALFSTGQNRRNTPGGSIELTERELHLLAMPGESTVTLLRIQWDVLSTASRPKGPPQWLNEKKLIELGFDCRIPLTNDLARHYYRSLSARPVFLVLEYQGEAWRQAQAQRKTRTRLFAIDAGLDVRQLRERYADASRYLLVRGLIRPFYQDREEPGDTPLAVPRLGGWIQALLPEQIFVPRPHNLVLGPFQSHDLSGREEPEHEPRFAATISWGSRYEPWITAVRPLAP